MHLSHIGATVVVCIRTGWFTYVLATAVALFLPVVSFAAYIAIALYYVVPRGVDTGPEARACRRVSGRAVRLIGSLGFRAAQARCSASRFGLGHTVVAVLMGTHGRHRAVGRSAARSIRNAYIRPMRSPAARIPRRHQRLQPAVTSKKRTPQAGAKPAGVPHGKDLGNFTGFGHSRLAAHFRAAASGYSTGTYDPIGAFFARPALSVDPAGGAVLVSQKASVQILHDIPAREPASIRSVTARRSASRATGHRDR